MSGQGALLLAMHAAVLLIGVAMLARPAFFLSRGSTRVQGIRIVGVIFMLWSAANLISDLN